MSRQPLPSLPLEEWEATKETLHRFAQVVGKVRLRSMPHMNHWWHVPLYVSTRGLTTGPMPHGDGSYSIEFLFTTHELELRTSEGGADVFGLEGLSVAAYYDRLFSGLRGLGIGVSILGTPFDLEPRTPFAEDTEHASYDAEYAHRWWRILVWADQLFKEFSGRFTGKTSPVHLYWHSFDLAVTRFSGRRAPDRVEADVVTREAYSHEVISFGFWAGDRNVRAPAFYSYTAPEPAGLPEQPLAPKEARWAEVRGGSMALLMYEDLRRLPSPRDALLEFLESAYAAGATAAGWDREGLTTLELRSRGPRG